LCDDENLQRERARVAEEDGHNHTTGGYQPDKIDKVDEVDEIDEVDKTRMTGLPESAMRLRAGPGGDLLSDTWIATVDKISPNHDTWFYSRLRRR
jgi:hypothetical protein